MSIMTCWDKFGYQVVLLVKQPISYYKVLDGSIGNLEKTSIQRTRVTILTIIIALECYL